MTMTKERIQSIIEAILFTADHPVTIDQIAASLEDQTPPAIAAALTEIQAKFSDPSYGFELRQAQGGYHFCTKVENADCVRKFLQSKPFRLGKSALETLAIIAYRQPITRAEIDRVRGIESHHLLRTLIERGLVKMAGKAEVPGRPVQYATTPKFLEIVGMGSLSDLPPLSELEELKGTVDDKREDIEGNLERFVEERLTTAEEPEGQYQEGIDRINEMLSNATAADHDVYESELHAEVAKHNALAVEGFQAASKPRRKTIQFSELVEPSEPVARASETVEHA